MYILRSLRVLLCIEALAEHVVCVKRPITSAFESSQRYFCMGLMGVSAPSLHIESTDSMIELLIICSY